MTVFERMNASVYQSFTVPCKCMKQDLPACYGNSSNLLPSGHVECKAYYFHQL